MAVTVGSKGVGVLFGLGKLIATMYVRSGPVCVFVLGAVIAIFRMPLALSQRRARALSDCLLHCVQ